MVKSLFNRGVAFLLFVCIMSSVIVFAHAEETNLKGNGGLTVINTKDCFLLEWDEVEGATGYVISKYNPKTDKWSDLPVTTELSYQDKYIYNGYDYEYVISYVDENGFIIKFAQGVKIKCLKAPDVKLNCTSNRITITWVRLASADGYRIYRKKEGDKKWTFLRYVKGYNTRTTTDYDVKPGEKYIYTVRQYRDGKLGSFKVDGASTVFQKAPTVKSKYSANGVVLNWTKLSGNNTYYVDTRSDKDTSWVKIATVNNKNTYTVPHNKVDFGYVNCYRIRVKGTNMISYYADINGINPNKPMVALTYDDGPYTSVTNKIVNTLKKNDARATFFVVGNRVNTYKSALKNAYNAGCEIGNHSYDHYILTNYNAKTIKSQIDKTNTAVKKITGEAPTLVRAPGGSINSSVKTNVKYPLIQWSVDTRDWESRDSKAVVKSIKTDVKDGSIILMHDLYDSTATATATIVPWLKAEGYQMVTVTELLQIKGYSLKAGNVYYNGY